VTLGRVRSPRGLRRVCEAARALAGRHIASWRVDEIVLYRSHLGRGGAVYEALVRCGVG
jgi:2'-5' RNA ligase